MGQVILVGLVVAGAAFYLARRWGRALRAPAEGCGCGCQGGGKGCPSCAGGANPDAPPSAKP